MRLSIAETYPGAENPAALPSLGLHRDGGQDCLTDGRPFACAPIGQVGATMPGGMGWATAHSVLSAFSRVRRAMRAHEHRDDSVFRSPGMQPA